MSLAAPEESKSNIGNVVAGDADGRPHQSSKIENTKPGKVRRIVAGLSAAASIIGLGGVGASMMGDEDPKKTINAPAVIENESIQEETVSPTIEETTTTIQETVEHTYDDPPTDIWGDPIVIGTSWHTGFEEIKLPVQYPDLVSISEEYTQEFISGYQVPPPEQRGGVTIAYGTILSFSTEFINGTTNETVPTRQFWINPGVVHDEENNRTTYIVQETTAADPIVTHAITVENWGNDGARSSLGDIAQLRIDSYPDVFAGEAISSYSPPDFPSDYNKWKSAEGYPYRLGTPEENKMVVVATPVLTSSPALIDILNPNFLQYLDEANHTLLDAAYTPAKNDLN